MIEDADNFDDTEAPIPDSVAEAEVALDRRQAANLVLEILTHAATPKTAGARAFVLAHMLKLGTCRTQRELARKLHLSPGRVSQLLNTMKATLGA